MPLTAFDFEPSTRVVFGAGTLSRLGELVSSHGGSRILLVSDAGLRAAGHEARAHQSLEQAGLRVSIFDEVQPNPTTDDIDQGVEFARQENIDFIVGLGGGSSMDCAKGINFVLTNGGKMSDYRGIGKATQPMLPLIAVPTTTGTGSEAQSFAVIADAQTHMKMACGDKKAAARVAVLDPELTLTMPATLAAVTGIDAISHAIESYVTRKRNTISQLFSREAWRLLNSSFEQSLNHPDSIEARGSMLLGAHFAGAAIENSMLGATHALANPLSARFGLTHGVAIGIMLPHVIRFNSQLPEIAELYGRLAEDAGLCSRTDTEASAKLALRIRELVEQANQPVTLSACGVDDGMFETLAQEAAEQWTGQNNPRAVDPASLLELYHRAY